VLDLINGLPMHPLIVHAVVVLLPLSIVGALALVAVPRWRGSHGPLVLGVAGIATLLIPVATSSGEELEHRVGDPGAHARLGDQLIWFALPLLILLLALVWLDRRRPGNDTIHKTVAALLVVAALATGVQTFRVGDSGARAAWGDQVSATKAAPAASADDGDRDNG
jgi:uncharacterized membrane protein